MSATPRIGVISDTHGHAERTRAAIERLREHRLEAVFHCGDIGSGAILVELASAFAPSAPVYAVLGNVDLDLESVARFPASSGVLVQGRFAAATVAGKTIAVVHGDEPVRLRAAIESGAYDLVLTGHTHERSERREGRTLVVNPGAVHRSSAPSVAVIDLGTGNVRFLELRRGGGGRP